MRPKNPRAPAWLKHMVAIADSAEPPAGARFLFYTNECVGLGHLRRTIHLAEAVTRRDADASALLVTGAAAMLHRQPHPRIDTVKLPEISRSSDGGLHAARLGMDPAQAHRLRSHLAFAVAESFDPSVAIVDKTPFGLNDELTPALEALRANPGTRLVLGLRDIEDAPDIVRRQWAGSRLRDRIARFYDTILVYGPGSAGDMLDCLELADVGIPVHYVGYVGSPLPSDGPSDLGDGYLLVTAGGGADGYPVFDAVLRAVAHHGLGVPMVMVTGPLMPAGPRAEITARAAALGVAAIDARDDMQSVIVGARAVVAMAGYNTVSEVLRAGKPLLLMPRAGPSQEQVVRATALCADGAARMLSLDEATPAAVSRAIGELLTRTGRVPDRAPYDGAARAARILCDLACEVDGEFDSARGDQVPVGARAG